MHSQSITLRCPAKLNLFLNINERYNNGYHELQTLFQMIDVEDEITFKFNSSKTLNFRSNLPELSNSDNLIIKATMSLLLCMISYRDAHVFNDIYGYV